MGNALRNHIMHASVSLLSGSVAFYIGYQSTLSLHVNSMGGMLVILSFGID